MTLTPGPISRYLHQRKSLKKNLYIESPAVNCNILGDSQQYACGNDNRAAGDFPRGCCFFFSHSCPAVLNVLIHQMAITMTQTSFTALSCAFSNYHDWYEHWPHLCECFTVIYIGTILKELWMIWRLGNVLNSIFSLTHCSLVTPFGIIKLGQHLFR